MHPDSKQPHRGIAVVRDALQRIANDIVNGGLPRQMKRVFQIQVSSDAPQLFVTEPTEHVKAFEELRGESMIHLSPTKPFRGKLSEARDWNQFYRVAPGGFAISEEAWKRCMDMYYVVTNNNVELLSVVTEEGLDMRIIHPRQFLEPSSDPNRPCDLRYANQLFRIRGQPVTNLFCIEGTEVSGDEFRFTYDKFGFRGLEFREIRSG